MCKEQWKRERELPNFPREPRKRNKRKERERKTNLSGKCWSPGKTNKEMKSLNLSIIILRFWLKLLWNFLVQKGKKRILNNRLCKLLCGTVEYFYEISYFIILSKGLSWLTSVLVQRTKFAVGCLKDDMILDSWVLAFLFISFTSLGHWSCELSLWEWFLSSLIE